MADKYELNDDELKNAAGGEIKIIISKEKVQKIKEMAKEKIREKISGTVLSDEELENASGGVLDSLEEKKKKLAELIQVEAATTLPDEVLKGSSSEEK